MTNNQVDPPRKKEAARFRDPRVRVRVARFLLGSALWLLTLSLAIWARSFFADDTVQKQEISGNTVIGWKGSSFVYFYSYPVGRLPAEGWHYSSNPNYSKRIWGLPDSRVNYNAIQLSVPCWELCAALAVISATAAAWLIVLAPARRRRRATEGRCVNCGYDLRVGHGRCPECGAACEITVRGR